MRPMTDARRPRVHWCATRIAALLLLVACGSDNPSPGAPTLPAGSSAPAAPPAIDVGVELARVAHGYEAARLGGPLVVVTPQAIVVDGKPLVRLVDGAVDPAEKEGGALGIEIPKLSTYLGKLPRRDELLLALHADTPYRVLVEVVYSAKQPEAGWTKFGLLARAGDTLVRVPVELPAKAPAAASSDDLDGDLVVMSAGSGGLGRPAVVGQIEKRFMLALRRCYEEALVAQPELRGQVRVGLTIDSKGRAQGNAKGPAPELVRCFEDQMNRWRFDAPGSARDRDLSGTFRFTFALDPASPRVAFLADSPRLIASVTKHEVLLWSLTGEEGVLRAPKLVVRHDDPAALPTLSKTLAEIVGRRWPSGQRPSDGDTIILQADGALPMRVLAPVFGAVRATPGGAALFPNIVLSAGFE